MAETRVFKTRGGWRYVLGLSSLVLSLCSGALFLSLLVLRRAATRAMTSPVTGEMDAPGLGVFVLFVVLACLLTILVAMALAAAALVKPGRGWAMAVAGWMVGASVLWYAGAQEALWIPFGGGQKYAPEPEVAVVHEAAPPKVASPMKEAQPKPPPSGPPEAVLTNAHQWDAGGFEGTFCWEPEWAENCVEDAGIPVLPEQETLAIQQGEAAHLVFVLRSWEREFAERNPVITDSAAYPLEQEARTVSALEGVRYVVPEGESRALKKEELGLKREGRMTKVVADVPEGEYVFQISARPPEGVATWKGATYYFRVLVLPTE